MSGTFTFSKEEKLCSRKLIDELFLKGKSRTQGCLRMVYMPVEENTITSPVQILITAPKKRFRRAVQRNLLKRRIREAYRLNKALLLEPVLTKQKKYVLAVLYAHSEMLSYSEIEADLKRLLGYLGKRVAEGL
jgi:ribonuclease P protein component